MADVSDIAETHGLTDKQAQFVVEYLVDLNATQAAIRAGYSENTAGVIGCENLKKPKILAALQDAMEKRARRVEVSADYVLNNLTEVVERCMQREPVMVGRGADRHQLIDDRGRYVWQFDANGVTRALKLVGQHLAMFTEKRDAEFGGEPELDINIRHTIVDPADEG